MFEWLIDQFIEWLVAKAILATLDALWGLLEQSTFTSPDVTGLPQVVAINGRSQMIVNAAFVLAVIVIGVTVMTHETVQVRYGIGDLVPRMVVGFIAANFATPICAHLIETANALTGALTGDGIAADGSFDHMQKVVEGALYNDVSAVLLVVIGLIIAVLTGMLLVVWLIRIGVLIVLVGVAPLALACHATPFTDPAARLWWRSMFGVLATVVVQALAMHSTLSVFLDPNANVNALGIRKDPGGIVNLLIVACLLWVTVKIPGLMRRHVIHASQDSNAGTFLRMMLIQAVSQVVRLPFGRRGGGRAAAGARGPRRRGATNPPGSVANTIIPYWRPRMPRPTPGSGAPRPRPAARPAAGSSVGGSGGSPRRSTRPPIRAAGVTPPPPPAGPRPVIPPGVNPATAMPKTRPVRPPPTGPWNRPRPPRPPRGT